MKRKPSLHGHADHALLEASTLLGGTAGAVAGAIGGPAGVAAGAAVGAAIGMAVGTAMDREDERASLHDRALDADIGVTSRDLGAREAAGRGLDELERGASGSRELSSAGKILGIDHPALEKHYEALVAAYRANDWDEIRRRWDRFEVALRDHMAREEDRVFPAFMEIEPEEATELLAEHSELRRLLSALGVAIDLHAFGPHDIDELLGKLRKHAERENRILYPWLGHERA